MIARTLGSPQFGIRYAISRATVLEYTVTPVLFQSPQPVAEVCQPPLNSQSDGLERSGRSCGCGTGIVPVR